MVEANLVYEDVILGIVYLWNCDRVIPREEERRVFCNETIFMVSKLAEVLDSMGDRGELGE